MVHPPGHIIPLLTLKHWLGNHHHHSSPSFHHLHCMCGVCRPWCVCYPPSHHIQDTRFHHHGWHHSSSHHFHHHCCQACQQSKQQHCNGINITHVQCICKPFSIEVHLGIHAVIPSILTAASKVESGVSSECKSIVMDINVSS